MNEPQILRTAAELAAWRTARNGPIHFVPTMGNLHQGHLSLVDAASAEGAAVIVSIFVNPTQFGPGEDFARYPRTVEADLERLAGRCSAVWLPAIDDLYPLGPDAGFRVRVPEALGDILCGAHRPGHFDGVANVVLRLFQHVRPDRALFGEKDYQQLTILRRLAEDFAVGVQIDAAPTVREADGLAMSSRNRYLSEAERRVAPALYRTLTDLASQAADAGEHGDPPSTGTLRALARSGMERLAGHGFEPEYVEFRDAGTLGPPNAEPLRLLAAARLGAARLIDNVVVSRHSRR
ncbi:pantoate--beta-alanine ligase [Wenzhouxiangella sp. XN79A]|uniref:pantoate--beta-alanine ligase n=1 Tax=Wenzhouxiangella sp. XN79A TaxID=2724193 RepID=UPI00144A6B22|nr:pantoate--beta-alanine ligase [Wenzhouxiangella sp. XN79A]NKI35458.1 pantoate--beta-alanine ligase [Wenzhouxiangella sp. XN79A]